MTPKNISTPELAAQTFQQLSQLLGLKIRHLQMAEQTGGSPGTVWRVTIRDEAQNESLFILKQQDDDGAYRLYQQYLAPYQLNSPKVYGYIELVGQRFWSWNMSSICRRIGRTAMVI